MLLKPSLTTAGPDLLAEEGSGRVTREAAGSPEAACLGSFRPGQRSRVSSLWLLFPDWRRVA